MLNFTILIKLFAKLSHTVLSICDSHLIPVDHQIPNDHNTFQWASRASGYDVTAIKSNQTTFACVQVFYHYCLYTIQHIKNQ